MKKSLLCLVLALGSPLLFANAVTIHHSVSSQAWVLIDGIPWPCQMTGGCALEGQTPGSPQLADGGGTIPGCPFLCLADGEDPISPKLPHADRVR